MLSLNSNPGCFDKTRRQRRCWHPLVCASATGLSLFHGPPLWICTWIPRTTITESTSARVTLPTHSHNPVCRSQYSVGEKSGDPLIATHATFRSASAAGHSALYTPNLIWNLLAAGGKDLGWGGRRPEFELHSALTSSITLTKPYNLTESWFPH